FAVSSNTFAPLLRRGWSNWFPFPAVLAGNDLMPASCILSIASAAAAAETGAGLGAIEPPLWSASLALTDCAPDSPIEHADTALPARAVSAVFRRKSRREPFLLN